MLHKRNVLILLAIGISLVSNAQKDYARKVVDTLSSPYMAGRGYVDNADKKAAAYISAQMKDIGLLHYGNNYMQPFKFNVNTFPKKAEVTSITVNNATVKPVAGADYIILPNSCKAKGTYAVIKFSNAIYSDKAKMYEFLHTDHRKQFVVVTDADPVIGGQRDLYAYAIHNPFKAKGIIMLCNKLTEETSDTVANYISISALHGKGFDSATSITVNIKNKFVKNYTSQNLIGYIKGSVQPDTFIVFSAHYDHLGRMGNIYFPGANDNASGTAMLLSLAKYFSAHKDNLHYSIAFIAFTGEEMGLFGSKYYTEHPLFPLNNIKFEVNMDIMGTGDEGITVVNATTYTNAFKDLNRINDSLHLLKLIKPRGATSNSDHYFFYAHHIPDFFIYTMGGIKAYHDIYDRGATLPLTNFDDVYHLLINFTNDICNRRF